MAYKPGMAAVAHKVVAHAGLLCHGEGLCVEVAGLCPGQHHRSQGLANVGRQPAGAPCFLTNMVDIVHARHIGHIAGIVAVDIDHHRQPWLDERAVGSDRQRRVEASATHGKIIG